jgi:hypothetical protein
VVAVGAAAGLVLRVWVIRSRIGGLDSDEAIVGLMAREMLHGHAWAFFWGQHYAGTVETAVAAAIFAVAGPSVAALKASVVVLAAVGSVLTWRVGRRVIDERGAQVAALLVWLTPGSFVWFSTKARGFYWAALALGLLLLLLALRLEQDGDRRRDWISLGLVAGAAWWVSPTVAYFAAPAGLWLLWRRRHDLGSVLRPLPATMAAFGLGALPWLWHNVGHGMPSLHQPEQPGQVDYATGMARLLWRVGPMLLGLRRSHSEVWLPLGAVLYLLLVAFVVVAVARRPDRPLLLVLGAVLGPFVYAALPGRWWVGEARYALFLTPFLFLLLAWAAHRTLAQLAVLLALATLSFVVLRGIGAASPLHVGDDIALLRAAHVEQAWAGYWDAYRLMFESGADITATPEIAWARHPDYVEQVRRSPHPAWIYLRGDQRAAQLAGVLGSRGVGSRQVRTPDYDVVIADGPVDTDTLPPELRL